MSAHEPDSGYFRSLPRSPDLDHLREEAKALKRRHAAGDADARAFVAFHHGRPHETARLADAQLALARAYGFKSWARLKAFAEAQRLTPQQRGALLLEALFSDNRALLDELYSRRDALPADDFHVRAAVGDLAAVTALLAARPSLATAAGGPRVAQALAYVTHGRFGLLDPGYPARRLAIVRLLLAHGADPNARARAAGRGKDGAGLSALYGCCRFPGVPAVAQLLLDAGATTDDGESLYHASELANTACLELLFAAGVPKAAQEYCIVRALDGGNRAAVAVYLKHGTNPNHLDWAMLRGLGLDMIQLLVEHGADVNAPARQHWLLARLAGLAPVQVAERNGASAVVDYLLSRGASDARTPRDRLIGACVREDEAALREILAAQPDVVASLTAQDHANLATFARSGRLRTVELMLDAGFDIEARADDLDATALLYAAGNGDLAMVELLLHRGARLDVRHKYDGTPVATAVYCAAHFRSPTGLYAETVRRLIAAGASTSEDSLQLATDHDLDDIAEVLKAAGVAL